MVRRIAPPSTARWDFRQFKDEVMAAAANVEGMDTLSAIAAAASMDVSTLSKWVNGRVRPSTEKLQHLANIIRTPVDRLYVLTGYITAPAGLPEPPPVRYRHPLVQELDAMLSATSGVIPDARRRRECESIVNSVMELYRDDAKPAAVKRRVARSA